MRIAPMALVLVAVLAARTPAEVHKVPQDHPTIQDAVDAAADSDTILVSTGVYHENVVVDGFSDLTIKAKGKVIVSPESGTALTLSNCGDCTVSGFRFVDCGTGLILQASHDVLVSKCRASDTGTGFRIEGGNDDTLEKCLAEGTSLGFGIEILDDAGAFGHDHHISHCTVTDGATTGIVVAGDDCTVDHCTVKNSGGSGIVLQDPAHCNFDTISFCKVIKSQEAGMSLQATQLVVSSCRVISPNSDGILDEGCTGAEFGKCSITKPADNGLFVIGLADSGSIHDCKATGAGFDGFDVQGSNMTVTHNKAGKCVHDGFDVNGSSGTWTSNTASVAGHDGFVLDGGGNNTLSGNKAHGSGNFDLDDVVGDISNVVDETNTFGTTGP